MALTPQEVRDKAFSPTRFKLGYNEDEVDEFLDLVETELTRLYAENEELKGKLAAAQAARLSAPAPPASPVAPAAPAAAAVTPDDDVLRRTLLTAQKTADEVVNQAREEAARLVAEAMDRAVSLERQASEQQQSVLSSLADQRTELEAQIEQLRAFEREYRTRLKAYLEMQLRELVGAAPTAADTSDASSATPAAEAADDLDAEEPDDN